jgi:hypothetical protein
VTGSVSTGGGFTDPFAPYTPPVTCDYGSTSAFYSIPGWAGPWDMTTTPWTLSPGTYCSNGDQGEHYHAECRIAQWHRRL